MVRDQRNSNLCDSETQNTHMREVGRRKESTGLINNLKQNNRKGEVVAQCYNTVNILCTTGIHRTE